MHLHKILQQKFQRQLYIFQGQLLQYEVCFFTQKKTIYIYI
jgi:hypothetical protein